MFILAKQSSVISRQSFHCAHQPFLELRLEINADLGNLR